MRVIATEEHVVTPGIVGAWRNLDPRWQDVGFHDSPTGPAGSALLDLGDRRLAAMDAAGIDVAVLSLTTPGHRHGHRGMPAVDKRSTMPRM